MYSQLPPLLTQADVYGQGAGGSSGASTGQSVNPASSPQSTANTSNAPAFSLVGIVLVLVLLRVAWEMGGEPGS